MIKDSKKLKNNNKKFKQSYFDYYDDIKDHTKGFREDW